MSRQEVDRQSQRVKQIDSGGGRVNSRSVLLLTVLSVQFCLTVSAVATLDSVRTTEGGGPVPWSGSAPLSLNLLRR